MIRFTYLQPLYHCWHHNFERAQKSFPKKTVFPLGRDIFRMHGGIQDSPTTRDGHPNPFFRPCHNLIHQKNLQGRPSHAFKPKFTGDKRPKRFHL